MVRYTILSVNRFENPRVSYEEIGTKIEYASTTYEDYFPSPLRRNENTRLSRLELQTLKKQIALIHFQNPTEANIDGIDDKVIAGYLSHSFVQKDAGKDTAFQKINYQDFKNTNSTRDKIEISKELVAFAGVGDKIYHKLNLNNFNGLKATFYFPKTVSITFNNTTKAAYEEVTNELSRADFVLYNYVVYQYKDKVDVLVHQFTYEERAMGFIPTIQYVPLQEKLGFNKFPAYLPMDVELRMRFESNYNYNSFDKKMKAPFKVQGSFASSFFAQKVLAYSEVVAELKKTSPNKTPASLYNDYFNWMLNNYDGAEFSFTTQAAFNKKYKPIITAVKAALKKYDGVFYRIKPSKKFYLLGTHLGRLQHFVFVFPRLNTVLLLGDKIHVFNITKYDNKIKMLQNSALGEEEKLFIAANVDQIVITFKSSMDQPFGAPDVPRRFTYVTPDTIERNPNTTFGDYPEFNPFKKLKELQTDYSKIKIADFTNYSKSIDADPKTLEAFLATSATSQPNTDSRLASFQDQLSKLLQQEQQVDTQLSELKAEQRLIQVQKRNLQKKINDLQTSTIDCDICGETATCQCPCLKRKYCSKSNCRLLDWNNGHKDLCN